MPASELRFSVEYDVSVVATVCVKLEAMPPVALIMSADPTATDTFVVIRFMPDKAPQEMLSEVRYRSVAELNPKSEMAYLGFGLGGRPD